jgi:transposase
MKTQAFTNDINNNMIQEILSSVGLENFSTYTCLIADESFKSTEQELIQALVRVVGQQYLSIKKLESDNKKLHEECDSLNLTVKTLQTIIFGTQSEKAQTIKNNIDSPKDNDNENNSDKGDSEEKETQSDAKSFEREIKKRSSNTDIRKNHKKPPARNKIPEHLQRVDIFHKAQFHCPICAAAYIETVMYDCSEELTVKLLMYVLRHKRIKLVPGCECPGIPQIYTSPKVGSVIYKGKYSNSLISFLLMNKFYMQVPIHRQRVKLFGNYGSQISEGTINGIFKMLQKQVFPQFYTAIKTHTLEAKHFHGDETSWKVFIDKKGKKTFNHWIWVVASKNGIAYIYDPTRSKTVVLRTFAPDASGIINVDRYASYNALPENIRRSFCWYHLRRDFIRLARGVPALRKWALKWIKTIRSIEKLNNARFEAYSKMDNTDELSPEFIKLHKSLYTLLLAFYNRAIRLVEDNKLHTLARKVLISLTKHWDGYMVFYEYPFIPMHNNYSERLLRSIANARNNFLGSRSAWSAELMAMVLSICETAKLHGLNPHAYMEYILTQCSLYEDRQIQDIQSVLPWNMSADILKPYENTQSLIPYIHQGSLHQNTPTSDVTPSLQIDSEEINLHTDIEETKDTPLFQDICVLNQSTSDEPPFDKYDSSFEGDFNSFKTTLGTEIQSSSAPLCVEEVMCLATMESDKFDYIINLCNNNTSVPDTVSASTSQHIQESSDVHAKNTTNISDLKSFVPIKSNSKISAIALTALLILFFLTDSFGSSSQKSYSTQLLKKGFMQTFYYTDNSVHRISFTQTAGEANFAITKESLFVGLFPDTS